LGPINAAINLKALQHTTLRIKPSIIFIFKSVSRKTRKILTNHLIIVGNFAASKLKNVLEEECITAGSLSK
jgi:hypothetical protein